MRKSIAALALVRTQIDGIMRCLAQWNENWQRFHFVGGHKRSDESFRECVIREVWEELGLVEGRDCAVGEWPLVHWESTAWSHNAREETSYTMELFEVRLLNDDAQRRIGLHPRNCWLTEGEILAKQTGDGLAVGETMATLLAQTQQETMPTPPTAIPETFSHRKDLL